MRFGALQASTTIKLKHCYISIYLHLRIESPQEQCNHLYAFKQKKPTTLCLLNIILKPLHSLKTGLNDSMNFFNALVIKTLAIRYKFIRSQFYLHSVVYGILFSQSLIFHFWLLATELNIQIKIPASCRPCITCSPFSDIFERYFTVTIRLMARQGYRRPKNKLTTREMDITCKSHFFYLSYMFSCFDSRKSWYFVHRREANELNVYLVSWV